MENTPPEADAASNDRLPLKDLQEKVKQLKSQISKVVVGQEEFLDLLIIALLSNGHVLIEGVPGVAKTLTAKLFSKSLKTRFSRIQFTPDLMPSDVLGTSVFNKSNTNFEFRPGPIFSNLVLIDEINRAPAKTQAALFEVMEERQVTIDGDQHQMTPPFMVLATQNPIEHEGTYALPEAQLDRFLFKIKVDYPVLEHEVEILRTHDKRQGKDPNEGIEAILDPASLLQSQQQIQKIIIDDKLLHYIARIVTQTRSHPHLFLGASPRASLALMNASKAFAAIEGRDFVIPEDIKRGLVPVLGHRVILSPEREMEGLTTEEVIEMISQTIEIPR